MNNVADIDSSDGKKGAGNDILQRRMCKNNKEYIESYDKTADRYDEESEAMAYTGPRKLAETMKEKFQDKLDMKILDVGAGSGLIGVELASRGYTNIDALDASKPLLEKAAEKKVYEKTIYHWMGSSPMPAEDDSYDAVVMSGAFAPNLMPLESLYDVIRVVRPGGHVLNANRLGEEWFITDLEPFLKKLVAENKWKLISRTEFPGYLSDRKGCLYIYEVL